jgi:hypothetical protein
VAPYTRSMSSPLSDLPDSEALLRRATEADALQAVGGPALRLYYSGYRAAAYTALFLRRKNPHPLIAALLADPAFFIQAPQLRKGRLRDSPRPSGASGRLVRTRWSTLLGLPLAPIQNLVVRLDQPDVPVAELPLDAGQRRVAARNRASAWTAGAAGAAGALFAVWTREIVVHNPYDGPIQVEIAGEGTRLAPHKTFRRKVNKPGPVEVRATTVDGAVIDARTLQPARQLTGVTIWNPGGRGLYFVEEITYGKDSNTEPYLLPLEPALDVAAKWAFETPPDTMRVDNGRRSASYDLVECVFDTPPSVPTIDLQATWLDDRELGVWVVPLAEAERNAAPDNTAALELLDARLSPVDALQRWADSLQRAPDAPAVRQVWSSIAPDRTLVRTEALARAQDGTALSLALWARVAVDPAVALDAATRAAEADPALRVAWIALAEARSRSGDAAGADAAWLEVAASQPEIGERERMRLARRRGEAPDVVALLLSNVEERPWFVAQSRAAAGAPLAELLADYPEPEDGWARAILARIGGDAERARTELDNLRPSAPSGPLLREAILVELGDSGTPTNLARLLAQPDPAVGAAVARLAAAVSRAHGLPLASGWAHAADLRGDGGPSFAELLELDQAAEPPSALNGWALRHHPYAAFALSFLAEARGDIPARDAWLAVYRDTALPVELVTLPRDPA